MLPPAHGGFVAVEAHGLNRRLLYEERRKGERKIGCREMEKGTGVRGRKKSGYRESPIGCRVRIGIRIIVACTSAHCTNSDPLLLSSPRAESGWG
jgi:hypothetical protein